jgi:hypothetical protein
MSARWVLRVLVRILLPALGLMVETGWQTVFADDVQGVAKEFVGRWQAASDLVYEFTADGKFRILRDPSKQPANETRWTLPKNAVSCTVEGVFNELNPKVNADAPGVYLRWIQQTTELRSPDGKITSSTEKIPENQLGTWLYYLGKTDKPKRTITVTTSRPVSDKEIALLIDVMEGGLIMDAMNRKKEAEKNTQNWERLGD